MSAKKEQLCPLFPDMHCPQGEMMSKQCQVRMNGDFDPVTDFRDHLLMHCALYQNEQEKKSIKDIKK